MFKIILASFFLCGVVYGSDILSDLKPVLCDQFLNNPKVDLNKVITCVTSDLKSTMNLDPLIKCFSEGKDELVKAAKQFCTVANMKNPFDQTEVSCLVQNGVPLLKEINLDVVKKVANCIP